jgi:hypothetical protein
VGLLATMLHRASFPEGDVIYTRGEPAAEVPPHARTHARTHARAHTRKGHTVSFRDLGDKYVITPAPGTRPGT